jgi:hypothetical protein
LCHKAPRVQDHPRVAGLIGGGAGPPRPGEVSLAQASIRECHPSAQADWTPGERWPQEVAS